MRRQAIPWSIQNRRIALIGVGQGVAVGRQGVGEIGRVEVHADPPGLRPVDPVLEVLGLERVALDLPAAGLGIAGVEVQAMRAGQERQRLVQIGSELVGRAGLAGIMAGDRQAAPELLARILEAADVVALPAMERDRDRSTAVRGPPRHRRPIPRIAPSPARRLVPRCSPEEVMASSFERRQRMTSMIDSAVNSARTTGRRARDSPESMPSSRRLACMNVSMWHDPATYVRNPCGLNVIQ